MSFGAHLYIFLLVIYWVKLLGHSVWVHYTSVDNASFTKLLYQVLLLSALYVISTCSTSLPIFDTSSLLNFSHFGWCVGVYSIVILIQVSMVNLRLKPFQMVVSHLYVFYCCCFFLVCEKDLIITFANFLVDCLCFSYWFEYFLLNYILWIWVLWINVLQSLLSCVACISFFKMSLDQKNFNVYFINVCFISLLFGTCLRNFGLLQCHKDIVLYFLIKTLLF